MRRSYTVRRTDRPFCHCGNRCLRCPTNLCGHMYVCSCPDMCNLCKHIHAVVVSRDKKDISSGSEEDDSSLLPPPKKTKLLTTNEFKSQQPQQVQDVREVPSDPAQVSSLDYDVDDIFQSWREDTVDQERLFEARRAFEDLGGGMILRPKDEYTAGLLEEFSKYLPVRVVGMISTYNPRNHRIDLNFQITQMDSWCVIARPSNTEEEIENTVQEVMKSVEYYAK
ncbi:Catalase easC [Frankliniella fusca]|uniref:Catalase easC n=1 Tax=Frankliniella fusca TaxID=407009 RepID=A0AAE1HCN9_9NEOP|nr:Catalase easC [Frankliniella fusca]